MLTNMRVAPIVGLLTFVTILSGCENKEAAKEHGAPKVIVSLPIEKEVQDTKVFTARLDAVSSVDIRARVSGYLQSVKFQSGAEIKKDAPLFVIDPRPYQATYDQAKADLDIANAKAKFQDADLARNKKLVATNAVSVEDYERSVAAAAEATASVGSAQAKLEKAKLDLDFTNVTSPLDGRISRNYITEGNLVSADVTLLTTIVSEDPIYAYFDIDENTLLMFKKLLREAKVKADGGSVKTPIRLELQNESGFPHLGSLDFVDNKVDSGTATLSMRADFANPADPNGHRIFNAGLFARVQIPASDKYKALLVAERAIGTDQSEKFVYVVNDKNTVEYRKVELGDLYDGMRVILSGVQAGDRVIVNGLQRVRPKMQVQADVLSMEEAVHPVSAKIGVKEATPVEKKSDKKPSESHEKK